MSSRQVWHFWVSELAWSADYYRSHFGTGEKFPGSYSRRLWSHAVNRLFVHETLKFHGEPPPETRLYMGQLGGILVPLGKEHSFRPIYHQINLTSGLFWLAFTTYPHVHWIAPIIASIPFGAGVYFVFTSVFTYLVTAYRPLAASAMASNSAMRSTFAAAFPLFAGAMYHRLGTVGATALLAGLTLMMVPLPWVALCHCVVLLNTEIARGQIHFLSDRTKTKEKL